MKRKYWTEEEFIVVFNLYLTLPFGKMDSRTKEFAEWNAGCQPASI